MRAPLTAALTAVVLCTGSAVAVTPARAAVTSYIRVNQVGYPADGPKVAFLLGGTAQAGSTFQVVDTTGTPRLSGTVGANLGSWNSSYSAVAPIDFSSLRAAGRYSIKVAGVTTSPTFGIGTPDGLYAPVSATMTRFFQANRDGADVLPGVLDRKPAHLADASANVYKTPTFDKNGAIVGALTKAGTATVDVAGGWFDAGDYLKFTHTTAYALDTLLVAQRSGAPDTTRAAEIDFGLGWLDKMWDDTTNVLYAQVGIGSGEQNQKYYGDHDSWRLPEQDDTVTDPAGTGQYYQRYRPVFRANEPGAKLSPNLAGRVAAAFALAAQVHASSDPARARTELAKAAAIYGIAKTTSVGELVTAFPHDYYGEDAWTDDMTLGAVELHLAAKALGDARATTWLSQAAQYAGQYLAGDYRDTLNLYDVSSLAHADLITAIGSTTGLAVTPAQLTGSLEEQLDAGVARAAADRFRAGAVYSDYDSTSHTLGLIAQAVRYRDVTGSTRYATFAQQQANWILGGNPWGTSLIVGVGTTYPKCPHHQVANLAGSLTGGGDVLAGAAVNGPNGTATFEDFESSDAGRACPADGVDHYAAFNGNGARYLDNYDAWMSNEPAIDFASTGALAFSLLGRGPGSGDGPAAHTDTIGVFRPADHKAYLRTSLTAGNNDVPAFAVGSGSQVPVIGDWDGDGIDGWGYFDPADRSFHLRDALSAGGFDIEFTAAYAAAGDVPIAGDFDGDGRDTVGTWRPGDQTVRLRNTSTAGAAEVSQAFGKSTGTPLTGDWDGDGSDSLGYYDPADRSFHLRNALTGSGGSDYALVYGAAGDVPVTGDWDGDGRDTIGVRRPSTKEFLLRDSNSSGDADVHVAYGVTTDRPMVGDWK
ncbi:glycoside hydrolase family 9 protein [Actinoplanes oblitus]|uniref:Glycoside hydrolase family 9 protein n=1 Tax=Actinoplanes oblitus TaxID=3040509 RepID=A0ABY8W653_9ACTN|nr:glycoside hydrolase family 9 protein [Actinoplanes oblitus]WIM92992.1 glycoside hydrolase family 9 protein [Actinoplanes oblitus]